MIPDEEVDRIRESADIVQIIGEHVALRRVGNDWRGPCPFHQGTHRNFSVSARRKLYHCFVCDEKGSVFTFLQRRLGVDFPTAVRMVAEKSGLELREVRQQREGPDPREPLWEIQTAAAEFFTSVLWDDPLGAPAREYIAERGVSKELADRFGLGFAPREIGLLRAHLTSLGYEEPKLLEAGLLVQRDEGAEPRPRFRGRLMFPIHDLASHVAGFGGRLIGPGEPKYLNSAESPIFVKGKLLYGLHTARLAARREDRILLVEGYFDALRIVSAGLESVVAPLGTALTGDQAQLLTRYTKNTYLLYDGDPAGLKATFRAGDELLRMGATVRVVTFPEGDDPDTFVARNGGEALEKLLDRSLDVFERKMQILERGGWFVDLPKRRAALDRLLPTLRATADPLLRELYIARASETSGVDRTVLAREVGGGQPVETQARGVEPRNAAPPTRGTVAGGGTPDRIVRRGDLGRRPTARATPGAAAERELVRALLRLPQLAPSAGERLRSHAITLRDARYREILELLIARGGAVTPEMVANGDALSDNAMSTYDELVAAPEAIQDVQRTIDDAIARLRVRALEDEAADIDRQVVIANASEQDALMQRKTLIRDEIKSLGGIGARRYGVRGR
ncbi:MAG: DNA primase [Gemmatimonadaceae bacterium]